MENTNETDNDEFRAVLHEARAAAKSGKYKEALGKYRRLFDYECTSRAGLSVVQGSYIVREWYEVGVKYPPALTELMLVRDQAMKQLLEADVESNYLFRWFDSVAAVNRVLASEAETVSFFLSIMTSSPRIAERLFPSAMRFLIRAQKYSECNEFFTPENASRYGRNLIFGLRSLVPSAGDIGRHRERMQSAIVNSLGRLVALLVILDRGDEASLIADEASPELTTEVHAAIISNALCGEFPREE